MGRMASSSNSAGASTPRSKLIRLETGDGLVFEVEESVALESDLIKRMIEDDCADNVIPMPNVTAPLFTEILDYCTKHAEMKYKLENEKELKAWDKKFAEVQFKDVDKFYELMLACNYLEVKGLLDLLAQTAADEMKGKTVEEIRKIFKVKNDFPCKEEAEIRKKNSWAFDY